MPVPLPRVPLLGLLGGPRRHGWIRLTLLVRAHPARGPGSGHIRIFWFRRALPPPAAAAAVGGGWSVRGCP
eukprot:3678902-Pyramimonas_sp.AAC.1